MEKLFGFELPWSMMILAADVLPVDVAPLGGMATEVSRDEELTGEDEDEQVNGGNGTAADTDEECRLYGRM